MQEKKGSISLRKDGRYMGRYYDSSHIQKCVYGKTFLECRIKLDNVVKKHNINFTSSSLLNDFIDFWWTNVKSIKIKNTTAKAYYDRLCGTIIPYFYGKKIKDATYFDLLYFFNENLSTNSTRKFAFSILAEVFGLLKELNIIDTNYMPLIVVSETEEGKCSRRRESKRSIEQDDIDKFLNCFKESKYYYVVLFLLATGMRVGEVFGLMWEDIDFDRKLIHIHQQKNSLGDISTLKTKKSERYIPLFDKALETLQKVGIKKKGIIFPSKANVNAFTTYVRAYSVKVGRLISPHDFRHTFASVCYEKGIDAKIVQQWLGHENIDTTLNVYTENMNCNINKAIELVNN